MLKEMRIAFTTDSDGDATVYGSRGIYGRIIAVVYDYGNAATGADITVSWDQGPGPSETILTLTNAGVADLISYPRRLVQSEADADLTGTQGGDREPYIMFGRPKVVVAQGGDTKSGAIILLYEE